MAPARPRSRGGQERRPGRGRRQQASSVERSGVGAAAASDLADGSGTRPVWGTRPVRLRSVPTGVPDSPVRVLVAHADPGVRRRLREALEHAGYQLLETESVAGAVAACRRESPAVAVVDAGLRAEDGRSALEHLKADADAFGVAVVLVQP